MYTPLPLHLHLIDIHIMMMTMTLKIKCLFMCQICLVYMYISKLIALGDTYVNVRALKSHALSVRLMQTNSILRSHAETIISHAFKIPCCFSEVPS